MNTLKHTVWLIVLGMLMVGVALPAFATDDSAYLIPPYQVEYRLSRGRMIFARLSISLTYPTSNTYKFEAVTEPIGLIAAFRDDVLTEISEGQVIHGTFRPLNYQYQRKGSSKNKLTKVQFDWKQKRVLNESAGKRWYADIVTGTQDKFSKQLIMMLALSQGKTQIEVEVADGGKIKPYRYEKDMTETIEVEGESYHTVQIKRSKGDQKSNATLWVDPARHYLPIKVHKKDRGHDFYLRLHRLVMSPSILGKDEGH